MQATRKRTGFVIPISCFVFSALAVAARAQGLPDSVQSQKNISYASLSGQSLKLDIYFIPSEKPQPLIIRFAPHRESPVDNSTASDLLKAGYTLAYAGYLPDPPADATAAQANRAFSRFPADLVAARQAVQWVHNNAGKFSGDPERIGLWGQGHGASLAALTGMCDETINFQLPAPKLVMTAPATRPAATGAASSASAATMAASAPASAAETAQGATIISEPVHVRALCLFEGITDWRYAELYGDESANIPGSPSYELFGGNAKQHSDDARTASAVNYIRPTSPPTLMVALASDEQRAMHLIFRESLRKAGVPSALYEEPLSVAGAGGKAIDETRLNRTVLEFFNDVLKGDRAEKKMTVQQEVDGLVTAGLFKQARRMVDNQINAISASDTATALQVRQPWLKKLQEINDAQQKPAIGLLLDAKKAAGAVAPDAPKMIWTIREVLTDPERIGQYEVEAALPQRVYEGRAYALRFVDSLNGYVNKGDWNNADRQANVMRDIAAKGDADRGILTDFINRASELRGKNSHVWPAGVKNIPFASDFGQDLYGYFMEVKFGGETQRFRYIAPGKFNMGSPPSEWGRLPSEPMLEPTTIAKGFWLADSPVTQAMWEGVMGKEENHAAFRNTGEVHGRLPAENLSYAHAVNFLNKLAIDARLPTEAEYEYALRAGATGPVSGTGRLSDMAWFWDEAQPNAASATAPSLNANGEVDVRILHELEADQSAMARITHPVKGKLPNRWGLYDMQGNVWEWCSGTSPNKPRDFHPVRGGSWASIPQSCRAARDAWFGVEQESWNIGLRICITAQ